MPIIRTPLRPVYSKKTTTANPLFCPLTGPINTTFVREMRGARWLEGMTPNLTCRGAYQMSDDGITWSSTVTGLGSFAPTAGWVYNDDAAAVITADQRLFVRFGLEVANVNSSVQIEQALARLELDLRPIVGGTLAVEEQKVFTNGTNSSVTRLFFPLLAPVPLEDIGEHRATLQLQSSTGLVGVIPAYQLSDDGLTWYDGNAGAAGTYGTFGTERTSDGTTYGTTFSAPTANDGSKRRRVRYGVAAKNTVNGLPETVLASLRVDYRRTT